MTKGFATWWTAVDMSTPLLSDVASVIDANPVSFYGGRGGIGGKRSITFGA